MHLKIPTTRASGASLPTVASDYTAGYDLHACLERPVTLEPLQRRVISTGLCLSIPAGFTGLISPRHGLAVRHGITLLNAPGIVSADDRDDVSLVLLNLGERPYTIEPGERIAQIVFIHTLRTVFIPAVGLAPLRSPVPEAEPC
ncbi:MAG: dUTP diphosphatase [Thiomonas arsenitoxydans]|jgi:dUTP pyrophosphatase|nr:dUTP diphosphatase [Thiomonas arsenitoxydans]